jgi:UDP-3-O-[3-hydroxymyristoyl] N-acetylglucosamine deacetylase/3-hydroxyacyl-[acyl-carrier-protein] dehydratase
MNQRTILREVSIKGKALHTGAEVQITFKPAPVDYGIVFRRTDLYGKPEIVPSIDFVSELVRSTTIASGHTKIHTIEHVLSALSGVGIDNVLVELNASEPPILDGSAKLYVNLLQQGEPVEQPKERIYFKLEEPLSVTEGNRSLIALPYDGFKITCTSADDRGIHTQHLSLEIDPEIYISQIAAARTFTIYEDIKELLEIGKIQGGSLDSAIVIKGNQILSREPLRFKDEFVRHKILDIIGDLVLLGKPIKAHIVAVRTGHALNAALVRSIKDKFLDPSKETKSRQESKKKLLTLLPNENNLDIRRILDILPHRYPFIMIDRVLEIKEDDELRAIKNVTINEPYFQGHFPGHPVMPGVLQIEAMAQAAGLLMLRKANFENKIAYFMSCDKVKFRQAVRPGDQIEICVKLIKLRDNKIGVAEGVCKVDNKIVSSAEVMFMIMDAGESA